MKTSQLLDMGSETLKKSKISSHLIDSEIILSKVLNTSRETQSLNFLLTWISSLLKHLKLRPNQKSYVGWC